MRLISRAELARAAGVSKQAISKACKKELAPACQGDRVDVDHPSAKGYLSKKGKAYLLGGAVKPADAAPTAKPVLPSSAPAAPPASPKRPPGRPRAPTAEGHDGEVGHMRPRSGVASGSSEDLKDLTERLLPLVERFGTDTRFADWLSSLKDIELIREKRLKNGETEGGYISRELVRTFVMAALDAANKRLLGDAAKTIASKAFNTCQAKGTLEEAQRLTREEIGKHLKPLKAAVARQLRRKDDASS